MPGRGVMEGMATVEAALRLDATDAVDALTAVMDRCADGDDAAFRKVYDIARPRLFAFFARQVRDHAAAEDLVHETLWRMYAARETFERGADVWPWAFAIARRLLIDAHRRSNTDPLFVSVAYDPDLLELRGESSSDAGALLDELTSVLRAELAQIPESHRAAFELIRFDGMSVAQAAEVLGATTSATKVRAHRVYQRLREALSRLGWEPCR
jgi:RNA polymerase sigma-70 factor, ECF subfamily